MPAEKSTTINISEVKDVFSVKEYKEAGFVACLDQAASQLEWEPASSVYEEKSRQVKSSQGFYFRNPK